MIFEHLRLRRRVALLAMGALDRDEGEATLAHIEACPNCKAESQEVRALLDRIAADPVRQAGPSFHNDALVARVQARVHGDFTRPKGLIGWRLVALPVAAAAVVAVSWLSVRHFPFSRLGPNPASQHAALPDSTVLQVPEELVSRMERRVAREQMARYLNDAQDVLITVATLDRHCQEASRALDIIEETRRSRDLLFRRVYIDDVQRRDLLAAAPLLDDVEELLRDVAELPSCVRPRDLRAIRKRMSEGRVLMKIDLMARELQG